MNQSPNASLLFVKLAKVFGIGLICLSAAGCYRHSFTVGSGGDTDKDARYDAWESHWFFGLIGESEVDVKAICPSGNATLKDKLSFLNSLVGALVGIVWAPSTVEVYCGADDKAASLTFSPEQMRTIALRPDTLAWARSVSALKAADLQSAARSFSDAHRNVASGRPSSAF
jgi:hypothetical protein